jgi:molecular chaperone GrpE
MPPTTNDQPDADDLNDADRSEAEQAGIDAPEGFDSALLDDDNLPADEPIDELEAARLELGQVQDQNLRLQAELENFRTRMRREMEEERRFALIPLVRDLLPAMDNVARAIEAAEKKEDAAGLLDGFKMVATQIDSILHLCFCHCYFLFSRRY